MIILVVVVFNIYTFAEKCLKCYTYIIVVTMKFKDTQFHT